MLVAIVGNVKIFKLSYLTDCSLLPYLFIYFFKLPVLCMKLH